MSEWVFFLISIKGVQTAVLCTWLCGILCEVICSSKGVRQWHHNNNPEESDYKTPPRPQLCCYRLRLLGDFTDTLSSSPSSSLSSYVYVLLMPVTNLIPPPESLFFCTWIADHSCTSCCNLLLITYQSNFYHSHRLLLLLLSFFLSLSIYKYNRLILLLLLLLLLLLYKNIKDCNIKTHCLLTCCFQHGTWWVSADRKVALNPSYRHFLCFSKVRLLSMMEPRCL